MPAENIHIKLLHGDSGLEISSQIRVLTTKPHKTYIFLNFEFPIVKGQTRNK